MMVRSLAILALCSCAPVVYNVRPVIDRVTIDPWLQQVLADVPVTFVPGSVNEWCPARYVSGKWHEAAGCYVDDDSPRIYVSTINLEAHGPEGFRYWQDILEHEYRHALGWIGRDT